MPEAGETNTELRSPVERIDTGKPEKALEDGVALCLSGGGYRAMLFHVGSLWRIYEAGLLGELKRVSSVSGGSIAAGVLALAWPKLTAGGPDRATFETAVAGPLRGLSRHTIDVPSVLGGLVLPGSVSSRVEKAYRKHLYGDATLQQLPDEPRFVINATNIQTGALWRFMKPYMADYRVGMIDAPQTPLARAVAASSAFPPVLSPTVLELDGAAFRPGSGKDLQFAPYTTRAVLSDGGVYDNLGLETAWKRYRTVLVSDAGGKFAPEPKPKKDWARHSLRVLDAIDNQVRSLRKRQLIGSYVAGERTGAYWGIRTDIADYRLDRTLPCPHDRTLLLAATPTRLAKMPEVLQQRLINWGFAVCDAALRKHYVPQLAPPAAFPYPEAGVG